RRFTVRHLEPMEKARMPRIYRALKRRKRRAPVTPGDGCGRRRGLRLWTLDLGPWTPRRGFTLLELLIAVSIFAIVLAAINGVFYAAMRLQRSATRNVEESLPVQQVLTLIKR